jgi:hypothetical protein
MPDFRHVITLAYNRILLRDPDPGGLEGFNDAMNSGLTEAELHEIMLRSPEYAERFPQAAVRGRARGRRGGRKTARKRA